MNQLQDLLKKTRLADSQLYSEERSPTNNGGDYSPSSPFKVNGGSSPRNNGGGGSPINQKNNNMFGTPVINVNNAGAGGLGDKNTQVMTQISAIYNKRSRSSNHQAANSNVNNGTNQTQGAAANRNTQQSQQQAGTATSGVNMNDKSPRVNRLKNYSPASREKPVNQQAPNQS